MAEDEKDVDGQALIDDKENGQESKTEPVASDEDSANGNAPSVQSVELSEFDDANILEDEANSSDRSNIDMILDISIPIAVELGRTSMLLKDVLTLAPGSIVELNKLAGDTVDLMIRGKLIAKGEVVVVDDNFGMRITSICGHEERLKNLT